MNLGLEAEPASAGQRGLDALDAVQRADVRGVVLAGVHAWGDCVLERLVSRILVPVGTRPLICHAMSWLRGAGIEDVSICANSDTFILREQLKTGEALGLSLDYYEDLMPRGPAGCIRDAVVDSDASRFVVVEGTVVPDLDLEYLLRRHDETGAALTVVASQSRRSRCNDQRYLEPAGVYVISRDALEYIPRRGYQDIKESLIPRLQSHGECVRTAVVDAGAVPRVSGVGSYLSATLWVVQKTLRKATPSAEYARVDEAWVHATARLDPTARLVGPVLIGPGCMVGPGAMVIGPAVLGEGCRVGAGAIVTRTVTWSNCSIGSSTLADQCILSDDSVLAPGTCIRRTICVAPAHSRPALLDLLVSYVRPLQVRSGLLGRSRRHDWGTYTAPGGSRCGHPAAVGSSVVGTAAQRAVN